MRISLKIALTSSSEFTPFINIPPVSKAKSLIALLNFEITIFPSTFRREPSSSGIGEPLSEPIPIIKILIPFSRAKAISEL